MGLIIIAALLWEKLGYLPLFCEWDITMCYPDRALASLVKGCICEGGSPLEFDSVDFRKTGLLEILWFLWLNFFVSSIRLTFYYIRSSLFSIMSSNSSSSSSYSAMLWEYCLLYLLFFLFFPLLYSGAKS